MKIAYILNSTVQTNGANMSFREMLAGVMKLGVEPLVICPDQHDFYHELKGKGIRVETLNYRAAVYPNGFDSVMDYFLFIPRLFARIFINNKAMRETVRILKEFKPDLIHTNVGVIDIGYLASRQLGIPHIFHVREYADKDFGLYFYPTVARFNRFAAAKDSYTVCITKDIQRHRKLSDLPSSHVIYNGIRHCMTEMPLTGQRDYFLYAGRIASTKGLHILLESYNEYCKKTKKPMKLLIAGSEVGNKYITQQKQFVKANGLSEFVEFLGKRSDINELMQHAKATVIPSLNEGFGRVMPEAMFNGCPVIVYDAAGSHEQLENGRELTGSDIAFYYHNKQELTKLLEKVSSMNDEELHPICSRAFDTVNSLYVTETNITKIMNLYNSII